MNAKTLLLAVLVILGFACFAQAQLYGAEEENFVVTGDKLAVEAFNDWPVFILYQPVNNQTTNSTGLENFFIAFSDLHESFNGSVVRNVSLWDSDVDFQASPVYYVSVNGTTTQASFTLNATVAEHGANPFHISFDVTLYNVASTIDNTNTSISANSLHVRSRIEGYDFENTANSTLSLIFQVATFQNDAQNNATANLKTETLTVKGNAKGAKLQLNSTLPAVVNTDGRVATANATVNTINVLGFNHTNDVVAEVTVTFHQFEFFAHYDAVFQIANRSKASNWLAIGLGIAGGVLAFLLIVVVVVVGVVVVTNKRAQYQAL